MSSPARSLACPLTGAGGLGINASPERGEVSQQDSVGALRRTKVGGVGKKSFHSNSGDSV